MWSVHSAWMQCCSFGQSAVLIWNESSEIWECISMIRAWCDGAVRDSLLVLETTNIIITHLLLMTSLRMQCSAKKVDIYCSLLQFHVIIQLEWFLSEVMYYTLHTAEFQDKYFTVLLFPCFVKALFQLYGYRALSKKNCWLWMWSWCAWVNLLAMEFYI